RPGDAEDGALVADLQVPDDELPHESPVSPQQQQLVDLREPAIARVVVGVDALEAGGHQSAEYSRWESASLPRIAQSWARPRARSRSTNAGSREAASAPSSAEDHSATLAAMRHSGNAPASGIGEEIGGRPAAKY